MDGFDIFNVYWPGGGLRVIPEVLSSAMHKVRQRAADSPVGQKVAQELGVKPKEITLPSGESVPIYGSSGSITWLLGGTNPSAASGQAVHRLVSNAKSGKGFIKGISKIPQLSEDIWRVATKKFNKPGRVKPDSFPDVKYYFDEIYSPMLKSDLEYNLSLGEQGVIGGNHYNKVPIFNRRFTPDASSGTFYHPAVGFPEGFIDLSPANGLFDKQRTLTHEMSHAYRNALQRYGGDNYGRVSGLPDKHFFPIQRKFGKFESDFRKANPDADFVDELLATNTEFREALMDEYKHKNGRLPSKDELFDFIRGIDDDTLLKAYDYMNDYSGTIVESVKKLPSNKQKDFLNDLRWLLTTVPAAGTPLLLRDGENGDGGLLLQDYKSGGRIHIKPENRGKFTALKKRTGHSASWFKEHGTPSQKKMAVFALNAKKWKHADGGILDRLHSVYGDDIEEMKRAVRLALEGKQY